MLDWDFAFLHAFSTVEWSNLDYYAKKNSNWLLQYKQESIHFVAVNCTFQFNAECSNGSSDFSDYVMAISSIIKKQQDHCASNDVNRKFIHFKYIRTELDYMQIY